MHKKKASLARLSCKQFKDNAWRDHLDETAPECAIRVEVNGLAPKELLAFPEGLPELAVGHAYIELCPPGSLPRLVSHDENTFHLVLEPGTPPEAGPWPVPLPAAQVLEAAGRFMAMAGHWEATGCFHRAALYDPSTGNFLRHVEDIGRHNCLDRLAGWSLTTGSPLAGRALFVTARATASLVKKAVRCGYAAMISRSAVTTAGVELAQAAGMTLLGFSRENRFSVFADPKGRIGDAS